MRFIKSRKVDLVINLPNNDSVMLEDNYRIRRTAADFAVPLLTDPKVAVGFVEALARERGRVAAHANALAEPIGTRWTPAHADVRPIADYYAAEADWKAQQGLTSAAAAKAEAAAVARVQSLGATGAVVASMPPASPAGQGAAEKAPAVASPATGSTEKQQ